MNALRVPFFTPEEYLALDRQADFRSEYNAGQMFAMAGASLEHAAISLNVGSEIRYQFRGRPCDVFVVDVRVCVSATGMFTYPDVTAVCGGPEFTDDHVDTLTNPTLIVEVLSPSTELYDRGARSAHYRRIPSLREYLLIAQDEPHVEQYTRQESGHWLLTETTDLNAVIQLESIGCELQMALIYEKIAFNPAEPALELNEAPSRNGIFLQREKG